MKIRLSSRQSALAQAQAYQVGFELQKKHPELSIEYLFRESLGDKNLIDPLWKMPEKGVFTEDFLKDLIENKTDMVVHSWKDLPTEEKADTYIAATLARADQRDLLLFKRSSLKKRSVRIFSSSPRRAYNIKPFLSWALPWSVEALEFQSVRGNVPTRIQKLLDSPETDGLILAKAALDRLLTDSHFPQTCDFLRKALLQFQWMVLPLSENPNAAAQGALAIEISKKQPRIAKKIASLNCEKSFRSAQREREILKEFGGGCHLALGMSVLERSYGRIEIVKGHTPDGRAIHTKSFFPARQKPKGTWGRLNFISERQSLNVDVQGVDAVFIAKAEAWVKSAAVNLVWTAGLQTWKKLAEQGVWVHGSAEGLGESEDPNIEILTGKKMKWGRLTHTAAPESADKISFYSYSLDLRLQSRVLGEEGGFIWKSGSEFLLALKQFPELKYRSHICGPGRTFEVIQESLGSDQNIYVELSDGFITVI